MYQKMTHTLEDLKKLEAMELRDVNREELVDILPLFGRSRRISGSSQKTLMRPS